jgi:hypothetical protein
VRITDLRAAYSRSIASLINRYMYKLKIFYLYAVAEAFCTLMASHVRSIKPRAHLEHRNVFPFGKLSLIVSI